MRLRLGLGLLGLKLSPSNGLRVLNKESFLVELRKALLGGCKKGRLYMKLMVGGWGLISVYDCVKEGNLIVCLNMSRGVMSGH